jgi:transposase
LIPVTGARKSIKVFGAVDVFTARFHHGWDTVFNATTYLRFLERLARVYRKSRRAKVHLVQDNASYHKDHNVWSWFTDNRKWLTVHQLPPYSPEFNAAERLWHHTRVQGTHNRYFPTVEELRQTLKTVFASMTRHPAQIRGYLQPFA